MIIVLEQVVRAPPERVFDLSRSIDLHRESTAGTDEEAIAGVTRGLIGMGEQVTWRARHFGIRQTLTSRIEAFAPPHHFRDAMIQGAFARFIHDHHFTAQDGGTLMRDRLDFAAPCGPLGWLVDRLVLGRYLRRFLVERNRVIAAAAESEAWRRYLADPGDGGNG